MGDPKFDGVKMKIGEDEYVVPPLSFRKLKALANDIKSLNNNDPNLNEKMDVMVRIIHAALSRNYPDITLDKVEEILDFGNVVPVIQAIMGTSGLVKMSGEMQAGQSQSGTPFIPTS